MAKTFSSVALVATALCLSSLIGSAYCHEGKLHIIGKVICDPCRVNFETTVSYPLEGSLVRLECTNRTDGAITHAIEGKTDANGVYQLAVEGDHEEEICQIQAVTSADPKCSSFVQEAIRNARISLAVNSGLTDNDRYANALFFSPETSLENCPKILLDMGILPPGTDGFSYFMIRRGRLLLAIGDETGMN